MQIKAVVEDPSAYPPEQTLTADVLDYGPATARVPDYPPVTPQNMEFHASIHIGQIDKSNADFIDDANNGAGIVRNVLTNPDGPFNIGGKVGMYEQPHAGCVAFVQELEKTLFPGRPTNPDVAGWLKDKERWIDDYAAADDPEPVKISSSKITIPGDASKNEITRYTISGPNQLQQEFTNKPQGSAVSYPDEVKNMDPNQRPLLDPLEEARLGAGLTTTDGQQIRNPLSPGDACRRVRRDHILSSRCTGAGLSAEYSGSTEMVFARVNKVLNTVSLVSQNAAEVAGAAGAALAAAFIILDFVNGNWVGGAFGAAGLALGIAATAVIAGPVGWIVGAIVSLFFAILPGLFSSKTNFPLANNMTQTIRFQMFGDAYHT